jgi:hypothetical protein
LVTGGGLFRHLAVNRGSFLFRQAAGDAKKT